MTNLIAIPEAISKNHQLVIFQLKLKNHSFKKQSFNQFFWSVCKYYDSHDTMTDPENNICLFRIVTSVVVILTYNETTIDLKEEPNRKEIFDSNVSSCGFCYNN